jgi:hypothetical protein
MLATERTGLRGGVLSTDVYQLTMAQLYWRHGWTSAPSSSSTVRDWFPPDRQGADPTAKYLVLANSAFPTAPEATNVASVAPDRGNLEAPNTPKIGSLLGSHEPRSHWLVGAFPLIDRWAQKDSNPRLLPCRGSPEPDQLIHRCSEVVDPGGTAVISILRLPNSTASGFGSIPLLQSGPRGACSSRWLREDSIHRCCRLIACRREDVGVHVRRDVDPGVAE